MTDSDVGLDPDDPNLEMSVQRTPTVLILDTSSSMGKESKTESGELKKRITQLNEGLETFQNEVLEKEHASTRVDVALVEFGGDAAVHQDFTNIQSWTPPTLDANGITPMGDAIEEAIDIAEDVKTFYKKQGISYTRPLLWLLTDGEPTDMNPGDDKWTQVQEQLRIGIEDKHFLFYPMGVGEANMDTLEELVDGTGQPALKIKEGTFQKYFKFVSNSLEHASEVSGTPEEVGDVDELKQFVETSEDA